MAEKTLSTRFLMRNDLSTNWESANPVLLKGEFGVALDLNKFKIGDGITPWNELKFSGASIDDLPRDDYYKIVDETGIGNDSSLLGDNIVSPKQGDIAVIEKYLTTDINGTKKYSHTGYVYDGENWGAMDGNYSAENVYFGKDLVITESFGKYIIDSNNPSRIVNMNGKNLYQIFEDALSEILDPTIVNNPSVSAFNITGNGSSSTSFEVGTTVTPQWTSTFNSGAYSYQSTELKENIIPVNGTGVTVNSWSVLQGDVEIGTVEDGTSDTSFIIGDGTTENSGSVTYTIKATYNDGNYALRNNNTLPDEDIRINGNTVEKTDTLTYYRKMFAGGTTETNIDSNVIRGLSGSKIAAKNNTLEFTAPTGTTKIILAFPKGLTTSTPSFQYFTMSWEDFPGFEMEDATIDVADARGGENGKIEYTIYSYSPIGGLEAPTQFKITVK